MYDSKYNNILKYAYFLRSVRLALILHDFNCINLQKDINIVRGWPE